MSKKYAAMMLGVSLRQIERRESQGYIEKRKAERRMGESTARSEYSRADIEALKAAAYDRFGEVAVLMNNAGVGRGGGAFDRIDGWRRVLWFSVILNINLALLNLLPLPMLDGGHILLSLIEVIRRRPSSAAILNYVQNGFAILLISFMVYIAFFDIGDWVRSSRADREVPVVFSAPK